MDHRRWLGAAGALLWAVAGFGASAWALIDVPTSERRAVSLAELASGSGIARPVDAGAGPLDDAWFLESYRALQARGLVDPLGERYASWQAARSDGGLHLETLLPQLEVRSYVLGSSTDQRLLYHTSGDRLEDGFNTFLSASGAAFWGDRVGGAYELQLTQNPDDVGYRTKRLYLKTVWGKWSLKAGRDSERLGQGYFGSLLLDDNAPTMDLWRVRTEEPLFLPGFLGRVGGFRFTVFNGYLSDDTPSPPDRRYGSGVAPVRDPRLLGMRFSYHPTSWFDLGFTRVVFYGGKGREKYDSPKDWWKLISGSDEHAFEGESRRYDNEGHASYDLTLRLPFLNGVGPLKGGKIYWELAGTDGGPTEFTGRWERHNMLGFIPFELLRRGYLGGFMISTGPTEVRWEYAKTDAAWYNHSLYPQGFTYRGRPLGHPMGGDAWSTSAEVSRYIGTGWRTSLAGEVSERGRSLPESERRWEGSLRVEALALRAAGVPLTATLDLLGARVRDPLDDPRRVDRNEVYAGLGLASFW
jgi:hypothetical protein